MDSDLLLPSKLDLTLFNYEVLPAQVNLEVFSNSCSSICPQCGYSSSKIHSYYYRNIGDLPSGGRTVRIKLQVGKYFCKNSDCNRKIFTERFTSDLVSYGRRFERLNEVLTFCGLELGGNSSKRQSEYYGVSVSASTILRLIKKREILPINQPKVIGVDDWAFKKRLKYGTIIVDLENHQVIDLLPDREAATLATWLVKYPTVHVVSRDRSNTYASAITEGRPQAIQVADRWHILKNLTETLEKFLDTQRESIKAISIRMAQKSEQKSSEIAVFENKEASTLVEMPIEKCISKSKYHDKFYKVKELQAEGYGIRKIASLLKMSRNTIKKYWNRSDFIPKTSYKRSNVLDFEDYLQKRWSEGQKSAKILYEEIKQQGFRYSQRTVYDMVRKYPKSPNEPMPVSVKATYYSSKQLSIWLGIHQEDWSGNIPIDFLKQLLEDAPIIKKVRHLVFEFKRLMKDKQGDKLQEWCNKATELGIESFQSFVNSINKDFQAIYQAFVSEWSNGQVEGQVNRLKNIKRQMYGRASFELLRKRVVSTIKT